jgi:hypothetical protein
MATEPRPLLVPAPLTVVETAEAGRFVVAARDLDVGEVVLTSLPYSAAASPSACGRCFAGYLVGSKKNRDATETFPRCRVCRRLYCSDTCKAADFALHRASGQCRVHQLMESAKLHTKLPDDDRVSLYLISSVVTRANLSGELADLAIQGLDRDLPLPPMVALTAHYNELERAVPHLSLPAAFRHADEVDERKRQ